jgi:hypothetical protein
LYLPDPAAKLAQLLEFVRPGGLVAFQELEINLAGTVPLVPLFQTWWDWFRETFRRAGFDGAIVSTLRAIFLQAGLPGPQMILESRVEGGPGSPVYELLAESLRSVLPMTECLGVATAAEVQVDMLAARLEAEICAAGSVVIWFPLVGAWSQKSA